MRYLYLLFCVLCFSFRAQAADIKPTVEEQVLLEFFASYQSALAYDEFCNGEDPKDRYDTSKTKNVMLLGNEQLLAARFGGLQHVRFPDTTVDELVVKLHKFAKRVRDESIASFQKQGCTSDSASNVEKMLKLYTTVHPAQVYGMIDKAIVARGGTVTSSDEIEAVGKNKQ